MPTATKSDDGAPEQHAISEDNQRRLNQIAEISKNARGTWFALIGVLLYSAITLAAIRDQDFFAYGAATTLPIVDVAVSVW